MDYCSACRRHINGALSCPGCGTPAEELGARAAAAAGAPASGGADEGAEPAVDEGGGRA
ncbi:SCO2400 family protein, partial [Actinacidiphila soli]